jgi:hypothetical protein
MLRELFALARDRGSRVARRFGHDKEAVSIDARHRRCRLAWAPHLEAVKACLLDAADACPGRGTAVILGSGPCLDVPLAALAARFAEVVLIDVHHPRPARTLAKPLGNVRLVAADLTGMALAAEAAAKAQQPLPRPTQPDPLPGVDADFTASVNLASQLPLSFYKTLGRRVAAPELATFCRGLIEAHLDWLAGLHGRVCLVCDAAWQRVDEDRIIESRNALEGLALPPPDRTWTWRIAPRPEESFSYDRHNQVVAYLDFTGRTASLDSCEKMK